MNRIELIREEKKKLTETRAFGKLRYRVHATFSWNGEQRLQGGGEGKALCGVTFTNCTSLRMWTE